MLSIYRIVFVEQIDNKHNKVEPKIEPKPPQVERKKIYKSFGVQNGKPITAYLAVLTDGQIQLIKNNTVSSNINYISGTSVYIIQENYLTINNRAYAMGIIMFNNKWEYFQVDSSRIRPMWSTDE